MAPGLYKKKAFATLKKKIIKKRRRLKNSFILLKSTLSSSDTQYMPSKIFVLGKELQQMSPLTPSVPHKSVGFFIIYQIIVPLNLVHWSLQLSPEDLKPTNGADIQEAEGQEQSH